MLGTGMSTLEIFKNINSDHQTIKDFVRCGKMGRKTPKKDNLRKLSTLGICKLETLMTRTPHHGTSKSIFEDAGLPKIGKTTRSKTLKTLGKVVKPLKQLS